MQEDLKFSDAKEEKDETSAEDLLRLKRKLEKKLRQVDLNIT